MRNHIDTSLIQSSPSAKEQSENCALFHRGQGGQALVEYVLILFVIFIIATFFLQFATAFDSYVDSYIGDYVACLLETGELPVLGNNTPEEGSLCESQFEPFSLASGRPPRPSNGGFSRGGGDGSGSAEDGAGAEDGGGGGGRRSGRNRFVGRNSSQGVDGGGGAGGRSAVNTPEGSSTNASSRNRNESGYYATRRYGRSKYVAYRGISGELRLGDEEEERPKLVSRSGASTADASALGGRPKKVLVEDVKKPEDLKQEDEEFSIGNFFRLLLMAAIIIALLVFLGGQVAQVAKGWES